MMLYQTARLSFHLFFPSVQRRKDAVMPIVLHLPRRSRCLKGRMPGLQGTPENGGTASRKCFPQYQQVQR